MKTFDDIVQHMAEIYGGWEPMSIRPRNFAETFGEVLLTVSEGDYQGTIAFLLKSGDSYGVYVAGYGSCSICDVIGGCGDIDELEEVYNQAYNSVRWFFTWDEMVEWMGRRDGNDWYKFDDLWPSFYGEVIDYQP